MPVIFAFSNENERTIYFLIQEGFFPVEIVQLIQTKLANHIKFNPEYTREELIIIAESAIEEYGGTIVPFTLFNVKY